MAKSKKPVKWIPGGLRKVKTNPGSSTGVKLVRVKGHYNKGVKRK